MPPNPYILAADNPEALVALLQENPSLAARQDEHGYSLIHAAASYNHLDLLRTLVRDFHVPADLRDEDGETALFVVETAAAARVLVEELGLDTNLTNDEGMTALQNFEAEGDFPQVAEYLAQHSTVVANGAMTNGNAATSAGDLPPVPEGLQVTVGTMDAPGRAEPDPDPEFRRRIEELAAREDFEAPAGQAALRELVEEAISGQGLAEERHVRSRQD